ncbi:MAG TPA: hydrogenase maturation protease [Geobacteraceae bacterium]|nr:hydrogenase maturation protease [Geobacteraceae bacterium]
MILIIGYGNSLRRDDGAGPALARTVKERCGDGDLRVLEAHQLAPELADEIAAPDVTAVHFMDASVARDANQDQEVPEGVEIRKLDSKALTQSFGHHFDPSTLLAYAEHLYGKHPQAWLISIPCADFDFGEGFSDAARASLASAEEKVLELLSRLKA